MANPWLSYGSTLNPNAKEFIPSNIRAQPSTLGIGSTKPEISVKQKRPNIKKFAGFRQHAVYKRQNSSEVSFLPYLSFQDLLNMRLTNSNFQQMIMEEGTGLQRRGVLVVDFSKEIDFEVFRNLKLEIRLRVGNELILPSAQVVNFLEEFNQRIVDVDFNLEEKATNISPDSFSTLMVKKASTLQHLELNKVLIENFKLDHALPNVKILKLWKYDEKVAVQVLKKARKLKTLQVACQSDDMAIDSLHGRYITKNLLSCVENSCDTLEKLEMEWVDNLDVSDWIWLGPSFTLAKLKILKAGCCDGLMIKSLIHKSIATLTDLFLYFLPVPFDDIVDVLNQLNLTHLKLDKAFSDVVSKQCIEGSSATLTHITLANMDTRHPLGDLPSNLQIKTDLPNVKYIKIQGSEQALFVKSLIERSSARLEDLFLLNVNSKLKLDKDLDNLKTLTIHELGWPEDSTFVKSVMIRCAVNLTSLTLDNVHNMWGLICPPHLKHLKLLYCEILALESYNVHFNTEETFVLLKTNSRCAKKMALDFYLPSTTTVTLNGREVKVIENSLIIRARYDKNFTKRRKNSICQHCEETSFSFDDPVK